MKATSHYIAAFMGLSLFALNVQAQKIYAGANFNYGFGVVKMGGESTLYNIDAGSTAFTSTPFSLGKGFTTGLYAGCFLKSNIGLELGVNYLYGATSKVAGDNQTAFEYSYMDNYFIKASEVRLVPTLRIKFGEKKLTTYIKTGFIVGVGNKATLTENFSEDNIGTHNESTYITEFTGGLSIGLHSGIGLNYDFGKLSVFAEATGYFQNWAPKHSTVVKNEVNGINALLTMTVREKQTNFVEQYSYDPYTSPNDNQPSKALKYYLPMSSIGISIGVQYIFGTTK